MDYGKDELDLRIYMCELTDVEVDDDENWEERGGGPI